MAGGWRHSTGLEYLEESRSRPGPKPRDPKPESASAPKQRRSATEAELRDLLAAHQRHHIRSFVASMAQAEEAAAESRAATSLREARQAVEALGQRRDEDPRWLARSYIDIAQALENNPAGSLDRAERTLLAAKWVEAARRLRAAFERQGLRFLRTEKRWDLPLPASARDQRRSAALRSRSLRAWQDLVRDLRLNELEQHLNPVWFEGLRGRRRPTLRPLPSRGLAGMRDSQAAQYLALAKRELAQGGKEFKRKQCSARDFFATAALHYAAMAQAESRWRGGAEHRQAVETERAAAALLFLPCTVAAKPAKSTKKKSKRST